MIEDDGVSARQTQPLPTVPPMTVVDWRRAFQAMAQAGVSMEALAGSFRAAGGAFGKFHKAVAQADLPQP